MKGDVLEVKADSTQNEFIGGQSLCNGERVINNIPAEEQAAPAGVNYVHCPPEGNEQVD